jgi:hypothetical protein
MRLFDRRVFCDSRRMSNNSYQDNVEWSDNKMQEVGLEGPECAKWISHASCYIVLVILQHARREYFS